METNLYRIVYCSRNRIHGDQLQITEEIQSILTKSRANNSRAHVTGALLYTAGSFAQVLEGSLQAIERIFECIQRDPRHSEVTVIQSGLISERQFPEWSMAFAGNSSAESNPGATAAFEAVFAHSAGSEQAILGLLRDLVVTDDDYVLLDGTDDSKTAASELPVFHH